MKALDRVYAFPKGAKHFHCFIDDNDIKQHPDYRAAKAGDPDAALQLVVDLALEFLASLNGELPEDAIFVSPYAKEATGDNAIPLMLSLLCAEALGAPVRQILFNYKKCFIPVPTLWKG
ncbi:MAG: hypothetical protein KA748_10375 [Halomonas sp.]|nr:hypothetical protein [Halomonas sp.]MBP5980601.1 hypothetical protein [Halomonas sp.]